jgi:hypothetical protein
MAQIMAKARNGIHQEMTAKWGFLACLQTSATNRKLKNTPSEGKGHTFESCRVRQKSIDFCGFRADAAPPAGCRSANPEHRRPPKPFAPTESARPTKAKPR